MAQKNGQCIVNVPNLLSCTRLFATVCFLSSLSEIRILGILIAALTDGLDGYLARRWNQISRLGVLLDPIADKVFVAGALLAFYLEEKMTLLHVGIFLLRDISLVAFVVFLHITKKKWAIQSFWCGKLMTSCQFLVLFFLTLNVPVPPFLYWLMVLFGTCSFPELIWKARASTSLHRF